MDVLLHAIAEDGLPNMEELTGRVAFIFDGCVVSGWPLDDEDFRPPANYDPSMGVLWEANSDVGHNRPFGNVTHWLEFPEPLWVLAPRP